LLEKTTHQGYPSS